MPVPSAITDLSQTAGSNSPAGSESPITTDDYFRSHASFIAMLRDGKGFTNMVTLAGGSTTDIGGQNAEFVEITGDPTITSFGTSYNGPRFLRFTGSSILTHNATTLYLPGGANITTSNGDTCIAIPNSSANGWVVLFFQKNNLASGSLLITGTGANNLVQLNGSSQLPAVSAALLTNVTPSNGTVTTAKIVDANVTAAKLDGAQSGSAPIFGARAWVNFDASTGTPTIKASGNVSTISDNGIGYFSVNFTTNMQDANYAPNVSISGGGSLYYSSDYSLASNTFTFKTRDATAVQTDLKFNMVVIYR